MKSIILKWLGIDNTLDRRYRALVDIHEKILKELISPMSSLDLAQRRMFT